MSTWGSVAGLTTIRPEPARRHLYEGALCASFMRGRKATLQEAAEPNEIHDNGKQKKPTQEPEGRLTARPGCIVANAV